MIIMKVLWNKNAIASMLLVMLMLLLAACGANGGTEGNGANAGGATATPAVQSPSPEPTEEPASTGNTTYPYSVTDATGTEVTFQQQPSAIVTLVPSETETVFAIGAGDRVVGVDEWSNYPPEAADMAKIGDMTTNIEAVLALNPDLVLASASMNGDAIAKLRELNVNVYASEPKTYDEVIAKIEEIGRIVNENEEAAKVAGHMREVREKVETAVQDAEKKRVYLEFSPGYTVGSGEFLDELLTIAGGSNIAGGQAGWYQVNAEDVIAQNPEVIIYPDFGEEKSSILTAIEERPGWEAIDAVKNGKMVMVTNDPLVRVGPRLAEGLQELADAIHPELMK